MDCAEEIAVLKREVASRVGGEDRLVFNLLEGTMTVQSPPAGLAPGAVEEAVARTGMRAELLRGQAGSLSRAGRSERHGRMVLTALSGLFTVAGFLTHVWLGGGIAAALGSEGLGLGHRLPALTAVLYALAIGCGGFYVLPKAWLAARRLQPDINLLMTLAVLGAAVIGEGFEAATVTVLFSLSLTLEAWSIGRARRAVATLLNLAPPVVRLKRADHDELEVSPDQVAVGAIFIVRPGERIALDGEVVSGTSAVNQAPITGESQPAAKAPGDPVFAGTINGDGALEVRSIKPASETTLAHIIRLVRGAQAKRARSEQWVDRFARVYTPAVMALAATVAVVPPLLWGGPAFPWFYRALVLLVIACPCALVISTPVSIVAGLAASARHGVLVKGGMYLELPARIRAVVFDKTGTLTRGELEVAEVLPLSGHSEAELISRGAAMEARSDHPIARAIVSYARRQGAELEPADDLRIVQGKGATARFKGKTYWLGSHRYLEERGQETEEAHRLLEAMADTGMTVVVVGSDTHLCGLIGLRDALRPEVGRAIHELRQAGVRRLVMLTGDNAPTAKVIARSAGVDEHAAELLPQDKVAAVERLVHRYGVVAMVGDGVNDAPAMARATLGIAMGAAGSDAAIETADVALMGDDLTRIPWLVGHSRRTMRVIRQNITFSLLVKAVFVVLTFAGAATLWSAIAADMGASLLVIFNGLRLLRGAPTA
ncbi:MAG: heavy metal translocating P-type ATPase [Candidatus Eisenbacteria bacterium]|nr:heavy metal translocating P-type ATPase [Candidatus Eisenbacteria bacterium]